MFIGHFAVAYAAKPVAPRVSLGALFLAAQLPDLVWPLLVLAGVETVRVAPGDTAFTPLEFASFPFSHSLAAALFWAVSAGLVYLLAARERLGAAVVAALVASHWVLDAVSHRADLQLLPGLTARVGLGLWRSVPATLIGELGLFAAGLWLYLRATRSRDRLGSLATWGLAGFLLLAYAANALGPPPPSVTAVALVGNSTWLLVLWAWWADRHREAGR